MCLFSSADAAPPPQLPPETARMKQPDGAAVRDAVGRRTNDRIRSGTSTILTSGSGVSPDALAPTEKKTLLGQ